MTVYSDVNFRKMERENRELRAQLEQVEHDKEVYERVLIGIARHKDERGNLSRSAYVAGAAVRNIRGERPHREEAR